MNKQFVYIVTNYGCNSTPSDMWIPKSKLFINYEDAYSYFLELSPSLHDEYNKTEHFVNNLKSNFELNEEYIIIENRV